MARRRSLLLGVVVTLSITDSALSQGADDHPRFQTSTELVSLNVTVTDQSRRCLTGFPAYWNTGWDGCLVTNLTAREFRVSEDGVPQAVTVFHRDDVSVAISLVIDKRSEAKARTTELTNASAGLIQRLRPRDTATVTDFVATPSVLSSLFGLKETRRGSATEPIRRHAIVFVTDAEATLDPSVVGLARRSGAVVYVIALMGDRPLAESREPALSLRRLASLSGGRAFFPADGRRLVALYNQIYEELSHQYTIGYVSTNTRRDGRWRNVIVAVERLDSSARTKQGYFAPEP